jgi:tetratricopeptide (TPR) repeat protein
MKRVVVAIWIGALAVRCLYIWQIADAPFFDLRIGDAEAYHLWAQRIAAGDWRGQGVFYQAPLYPYFLAILYRIFGDGALPVRLIQAVIGATSCALLAAAGASLWGKRGVVAGVMLAIYPTAIFLDGLLEKSSLVTLFASLLLVLLATSRKPSGTGRWLATGIVLGLLILTRENAILLAVPLLLWITLKDGWNSLGESWPAAAMLVAGCALVLLPVGLRNHAVGGEFHLTTSQFGPNFYIGNHPGATGTYEALVEGHGSAADEREDATRLAEQSAGRQLTAQEVSSFWTRRSLDYIRSQPAEWVKLLARKTALTFNAATMDDTESQAVYAEWSPLLRLLSVFGFGLLLAVAAYGASASAAEWLRLWWLYAVGATYAASVIVFYVFERYRFPLVLVLMLFAAAAFREMRSRKRRSAPFLAAAAALAVAYLPVGDVRGSQAAHYFAIASAMARNPAQVEQAEEFYARALNAAPDFPAAEVGLATLLTRTGRASNAIPYYEAALKSWPDYAEAHFNLGVALQASGRLGEAADEFEKALRLHPGYVEARRSLAQTQNNLGAALAGEGRMAEAIAHFERSLALDPADENVKRNLDLARQMSK